MPGRGVAVPLRLIIQWGLEQDSFLPAVAEDQRDFARHIASEVTANLVAFLEQAHAYSLLREGVDTILGDDSMIRELCADGAIEAPDPLPDSSFGSMPRVGLD